MSHYEWQTRQFQLLEYTDIGSASPVTSDSLVEYVDTGRLVRTQVWWDVRFRVPEDHVTEPRAPYPLILDVFAANNSEDHFPIGQPEDPVLTTMMCATPTESFGEILGTSEIQHRLWVGNSGGAPLESQAERTGNRSPFSFNLRARVSIFNDESGPSGSISEFPALFLIRMRFLMHLDF